MPDRIQVDAPGGGYPILIENGLLRRIVPDEGRRVVITNTTLAPLYGETLAQRLGAACLTMPDGEQFKTLDTVSTLYDGMVAAGMDRGGTVYALGGGVVGDTAGFVAATYMRGVRLVQIPTTLLAMVDSSVGGKVGIDLPQGKNLVGAFKQPDQVLIDPEVLATLPAREWRCGMAEVIKHGLLADPGLLDDVTDTPRAAEAMIYQAVQVKVGIVQADPYEQGKRAHLNLGHTFGHAIEIVSEFAMQHGEAVAVGLVAAARLSALLKLCEEELPGRVEAIIQQAGLPVRMGNLDIEAIYAVMATDKKWKNGQSRFVLLRGIGQPLIMEGIDKERVFQVLNSLK